MLRRFGIAGALCGTASGGYLLATDDGTRRSFLFWSSVFPIYVKYRGVQFLNRDIKFMDNNTANNLYESFHVQHSDEIRDLTYKLRGFYLKQAQLMSIQDDFVPAAYMTWVKNTQDNVPSEFHGNEARLYVAAKMKEELNKDFDEVFEFWDDNPIGVASISQVHKARLKDGKRLVAVKILCPGMEKKFRGDIATLKSFCELAMPQHTSSFNEIEKQFMSEFNFIEEAKNLQEIRNNILPRFYNAVDIPEPIMPLCSKNILVMDVMDGVKLVDGIRNQYRKLAAMSGRSLEDLENERKQQIKQGNISLQSIASARVQHQRTKLLITLNDILFSLNIPRLAYNLSPLRLIFGPVQYSWTETPIDLGQTMELLAQLQASQIFEDGVFNGDSHPGNILLLSNGKIGLIDFGQVKRISEEQRINYAKLIIALKRKDEKEVARLYFDVLKTQTKFRRSDIAVLLCTFYNDRNINLDHEYRMNIASFIDYCQAQDPMIQLPEDYVLCSRSSLMLRGMGNAFGLDLSVAELWYKPAQDFLQKKGIVY